MERKIDWFLNKYGESHQNATNKLIHWVCVPAIMFTIFAILYAIPFPFAEKAWYANWGALAMLAAWAYYLRLSVAMFMGFVLIGLAMLIGSQALHAALNYSDGQLAIAALIIFAVAWVFQFIGHNIEGKKPSFLEDVQFLLIGPAWLMHFIFKKVGISY